MGRRKGKKNKKKGKNKQNEIYINKLLRNGDKKRVTPSY